jgi:hypothetical protein
MALSSLTSAAIGRILEHNVDSVSLVAAASTFILGTLWAGLVRWRRTIAGTSFRLGWVASMPLAALDAAVVSEDLFNGGISRLGLGPLGVAVLGATVGAVVWVPAVLVALLCFAAPIAWAQRLAARGLAGEERGERMVGLATATMSMIAVALAAAPYRTGVGFMHPTRCVPGVLGMLGALLGGTAALLAFAHERRRQSFVSAVVAPGEEGRVANLDDEVD